MGGFDTLALGSKILFGDNWFSDFNAALHESSIYNITQTTIASVAVFTGGMNSGFNKAANSAGVKPSCFVAGTLVMAVAGMVAIETIKSGDKVISTDPETMETSPKTVLETYIREVTTLVHLTVNGEEIVTTVDHPFYVKNQGFIKAGDKVISTNHETFETAEKTVVETYVREDSKLIHLVINGEEIITTETHPFYVTNRGFVNAGELKVGDELLDSNGNILLVENFAVELTDEPTTVYNFQVEDYHTYHVSGLAILVHNAGDDYRNVPVPERKKASNGLGYKSNPKHTPGQPGNRPNAGTEPRNSFELFGDSTPSNKNPRQRYTYEKSTGTLHRFSPTENDGSLWHWSGSTNQGPNSLKGSQVPNDIKNLFHLPKKGW